MNETREGKFTGRQKKTVLRIIIDIGLAVLAILLLFGLTTLPDSNPDESETGPVLQTTDDAADAAKSEADEEEIYDPFEPMSVDSTQPSNYILSTEILSGGEITSDYQAEETIYMDVAKKYAGLEGIMTFRGDNFRSGSSYGTTTMTSKNFGNYWTQSVSTLVAPDGNIWTGCGWTGQPLIVTWPQETRQIMNLHDWAKEAETLTEVIYATMDGNIYFMDLESGEQTRDPLYMGYTFKGSGALDPRGYPVLYVGAGYASNEGSPKAFAISLIDGSILFTFGDSDSFALRDWPCFDSSPLVDAETDQLIYPGENGVLYIVKLNTQYDETAGTLTMEPEYVKWRYQGVRSSGTSYWLGMESSAAIWQSHLFIADNGGYLMCLDLETLKLVWVQDILDDTNGSPTLELEDGQPYLYISPSFHLGWRSYDEAEIPIYKIGAETGEIVWDISYTCSSEDGVSGGVQGTIAIGKQNLSDLVFVPVSRTGTYADSGIMVAIDKASGEVVWELETNSYSWASPTIVYDENGDGYLIFGTLYGSLCLVDGMTGELLDSMELDGHIESTAAVYENTVVIGARSSYIYGITLE